MPKIQIRMRCRYPDMDWEDWEDWDGEPIWIGGQDGQLDLRIVEADKDDE